VTPTSTRQDRPGTPVRRPAVRGATTAARHPRRLPGRLPLLSLLALAALPVRGLAAQAAAPAVTPAVAARIRQVEAGLLPNVPVDGMAAWRLADRMRFTACRG
jgi:hypothetical protein